MEWALKELRIIPVMCKPQLFRQYLSEWKTRISRPGMLVFN